MAAVRRTLKRFPEIVKADISAQEQRATLWAKPSFNQWVALEHAIEDGGGFIKMFHPEYVVPQAYYATIGGRSRELEDVDRLQAKLQAVPGVRTALIDPERWFVNEKGLQIGGAVVFADRHPRLELGLINAAKEAGFLFEPKVHGHAADDHDEWSEMNHAFAGICLLFLAALGMLQLGLTRPPAWIRYGTVFIWLALFLFLFIRSDRNAWPLGKLSWWESFQEWDTAQHRLGIGLVLLIGFGDFLRIRKGWQVNPVLSRWTIFVIGVIGTTTLYMHRHETIDPEHYAMVARMNAQHVAMATTAGLFTLSKFAWDTWQVPRKGGQYVWLVFLGILGVLLALYVE